MVADTTVPRLARQKFTGEVLEDRSKSGKLQHWKKRKEESLAISEAYFRLGENRHSIQIGECGTRLVFAECPAGHQKKLINANFCRKRLCSTCTSRRARLIASQVRSVGHEALLRQPKLRFIFLTLTIPNVPGDCIGDSITELYTAFQKLLRVSEVKKVVEGYFRAFEITYNKKRNDYHPHLHVLIAVGARYFKESYIDQQRWLELWRNASGNSQITQVDVRIVKSKKSGDSPLAGAAAEASKYAVKAKEIIQCDPAETAKVLGYLHEALRGRRLTQFGGSFRKIKKELKLVDAENASAKDLVAIGKDPSCFCSFCNSPLCEHVYYWTGGIGEYVG